jgi:hypothetical protein
MRGEADGCVSKLDGLIGYLQRNFVEYPFDEEKDRPYFCRLIDEFGDLDIDDELRQYHAWVLDQSSTKKIYYRSRFRSWLKTSWSFHKVDAQPAPSWMRRRRACSRY